MTDWHPDWDVYSEGRAGEFVWQAAGLSLDVSWHHPWWRAAYPELDPEVRVSRHRDPGTVILMAFGERRLDEELNRASPRWGYLSTTGLVEAGRAMLLAAYRGPAGRRDEFGAFRFWTARVAGQSVAGVWEPWADTSGVRLQGGWDASPGPCPPAWSLTEIMFRKLVPLGEAVRRAWSRRMADLEDQAGFRAPTARAVAAGMRAAGCWDYPILADALEDGGVTDAAFLTALRDRTAEYSPRWVEGRWAARAADLLTRPHPVARPKTRHRKAT